MNQISTKPTPGPWRMDEREFGTAPGRDILRDVEYVPGAQMPTTYRIASVLYPTTQRGTEGALEREANARLIAAAPELLAAAEAYVATVFCHCYGLEDAPFDGDLTPQEWVRLHKGECHWCKAKAAVAKATGDAS